MLEMFRGRKRVAPPAGKSAANKLGAAEAESKEGMR
jgi:hypothetical protein